MIYTCVAVDDEPSSLEMISIYLRELPSIRLVLSTLESLEAKLFIENNKADLLITDIDMPELDGIALNNAVKHLCHTIFITAHTTLGKEALGNNAIDILEKPIPKNVFSQAIEKAIKIIEHDKLQKSNELLLEKYAILTDTEKKILLEIGRAKNNKDITNENSIATNTLDKHKTNLKNKLGLKNTSELIIFAHDILIIKQKDSIV